MLIKKENPAFMFFMIMPLIMFSILGCLQSPDVTPPGPVNDLQRTSYLNGEYTYIWSDPEDSDLDFIQVKVEPFGNSKRIDAGTESASISVPSTEQVLLTSVTSVDDAGNKSEPKYLLFPGETEKSTIEFYDETSTLTATNVYQYDTNGIETGFTAYIPDTGGSIDFYRERTAFSNSGVFTKESDYDNTDTLISYAVLSINNETRSLSYLFYSNTDVLQNSLYVKVPEDGIIDYANIYDADGNLIQRQYAEYDENGFLTAYIYRDANDNLLEKEEYVYDANDDLIRKYKYDSSNTLVQTLEFVP